MKSVNINSYGPLIVGGLNLVKPGHRPARTVGIQTEHLLAAGSRNPQAPYVDLGIVEATTLPGNGPHAAMLFGVLAYTVVGPDAGGGQANGWLGYNL